MSDLLLSNYKITDFAHDITLFGTAKDEGKSMSDELQRISLWMESNKLTVNAGQSKVLHFKPKLNYKINLNDKALELLNKMKYLGVTVDNTLKHK